MVRLGDKAFDAATPRRYSGISSRSTLRKTSSVTGEDAFDRYERSASFIRVWYPELDFSARARNSSRMALSMKIDIRVLPFCGMTAPRLPFAKSYSPFINPSLFACRTPRRNETGLAAAVGVDDDKRFAIAAKTNRDKAWFTRRAEVLYGHCHRIEQDAFRIRERNAMLLEIGRGFEWIVQRRHIRIIYTLYVSCKRYLRGEQGCAGGPLPPLRLGDAIE